jgi:hypothetical protein
VEETELDLELELQLPPTWSNHARNQLVSQLKWVKKVVSQELDDYLTYQLK